MWYFLLRYIGYKIRRISDFLINISDILYIRYIIYQIYDKKILRSSVLKAIYSIFIFGLIAKLIVSLSLLVISVELLNND